MVAKNRHHSEEFDMFIEIVAQVRGMTINDDSIVTKKVSSLIINNCRISLHDRELSLQDEEKFFYIDFESVGIATCLILNFGDTPDLEAYGEEQTCKKNFTHATYDGSKELKEENTFTHTYE